MAISLLSFAAAAVALVVVVRASAGAVPAAVVSAAVFLLQPDLLYLQATPMTEPLLLGLTVLGVALPSRVGDDRRDVGGVAGRAGAGAGVPDAVRGVAGDRRRRGGVAWLRLLAQRRGRVARRVAGRGRVRVGVWPLGAFLGSSSSARPPLATGW